jgi:exopolysaccharide production protein ExoZ
MLPRQHFLAIATIVFGVGIAIGSAFAVPPWATVAVRPLVLEFLLGATIGLLFRRGFALPIWLAIAIMIFGSAEFIFAQPASDWPRVFTWGAGSGLILIGALALERFGIRVPKLLVALGASSYSLYLTHPFVLSAFAKTWAFVGFTAKMPASVPGIAAFIVALAVGHALYLMIEKRITDSLKTAPRIQLPSPVNFS